MGRMVGEGRHLVPEISGQLTPFVQKRRLSVDIRS